jgi:hypothetical protein
MWSDGQGREPSCAPPSSGIRFFHEILGCHCVFGRRRYPTCGKWGKRPHSLFIGWDALPPNVYTSDHAGRSHRRDSPSCIPRARKKGSALTYYTEGREISAGEFRLRECNVVIVSKSFFMELGDLTIALLRRCEFGTLRQAIVTTQLDRQIRAISSTRMPCRLGAADLAPESTSKFCIRFRKQVDHLIERHASLSRDFPQRFNSPRVFFMTRPVCSICAPFTPWGNRIANFP